MKSFDEPKITSLPTGKFKRKDEYGYFTNLNNEIIRREYKKYKSTLENKRSFIPLSDEERHIFDMKMMNKYKKEYEAFYYMLEWEKNNAG